MSQAWTARLKPLHLHFLRARYGSSMASELDRWANIVGITLQRRGIAHKDSALDAGDLRAAVQELQAAKFKVILYVIQTQDLTVFLRVVSEEGFLGRGTAWVSVDDDITAVTTMVNAAAENDPAALSLYEGLIITSPASEETVATRALRTRWDSLREDSAAFRARHPEIFEVHQETFSDVFDGAPSYYGQHMCVTGAGCFPSNAHRHCPCSEMSVSPCVCSMAMRVNRQV